MNSNALAAILAIALAASPLAHTALAQPTTSNKPTEAASVTIPSGRDAEATLRLPAWPNAKLAGSRLVRVAGSPGLSAELLSVAALEDGTLEVRLRVAHARLKGTPAGTHGLAVTLETADGARRELLLRVRVEAQGSPRVTGR